MSTFNDDDIREALNREYSDAELERAGDEGLWRQVAATFKSRMRFWVILIWIVALVLTAACVWLAVMFFQAETTRDWIMYATGFLLALMMIGHIKLWYYMEMNKNTHTREIKRLELQLAQWREELKG